jgi:hypothetical protein
LERPHILVLNFDEGFVNKRGCEATVHPGYAEHLLNHVVECHVSPLFPCYPLTSSFLLTAHCAHALLMYAAALLSCDPFPRMMRLVRRVPVKVRVIVVVVDVLIFRLFR